MTYSNLKIFSGSSNLPLATAVAAEIGIPLGKLQVDSFADGETCVRIEENIRGQDVFILQSTNCPVNNHLMELLILIDAAKRASAERITAVIPYFGYARQDRKARGREPITAKLVANLLETAGVDRVITLDLHSGQIQGFFDIPVDNLMPDLLFINAIQPVSKNTVVVAPDAGASKRAGHFARRLGAELAIIDKRRPQPNQSVVENVIGDVNGKTCILFDDIADTCGTLINAASALKKQGADHVQACVSHGLFSGDSLARITHSDIEKIFITDSIRHHPFQDSAMTPRIQTISIAPLLSKAIQATHCNESVSSLFNKPNCP